MKSEVKTKSANLKKSAIEQRVKTALLHLHEKDAFLLEHNVSERSITHRLALHLSSLFPDYDIDCEYNSNIEAQNGRKYITFLKKEAEKNGLIRNSDNLDEDYIYRAIFPDIIIHKRGKNGSENNLVIIEVKKESSRVSANYDFEKLKKYTCSDGENVFAYSYGLFINIPTGNNFQEREFRFVWFENGQEFKE